jgi:GAF domain-containing protein
MKCPRCEHENPSQARFCMACGAGLSASAKLREAGGVRGSRRKSPKSERPRVHDIEKRLAEALKRETEGLKREAEAQEQQAATAEILRVISSSPADVQPVFDVIVRSAVRLCDGLFGSVFRFDGELMHLAAHHNYTPTAHHALLEMLPMQPRLDSPLTAARAILTRAVVQFEDMEDAETAREYAPHVARAGGFRSGLAVPMLRDGNPLGAIFVAREQPGPFSAARIELVKTFADQAVIAIENVRLFNETKEALEQQTATSEILKVISSSPTDIQPVLHAVARSATHLCEAYDALIALKEGETLRVAAHHGPIPTPEPRPLTRDLVMGRAVVDRQVVHVHDLSTAGAEFPLGQADAVEIGFRTTLGVPLVRESEAIGAILIRRLEVRPFSEQQIALLKTFADQAVIAIENVRLFNETKEALEQQTATAQILRAISGSPTDVQPVFDMIAARAMTLCDARVGGVFRFDGELIHLVALANVSSEGAEALRSVYPMPPSRRSTTGRAVLTGNSAAVPDVFDDPEFGIAREAETSGFRSVVSVPMLRDGRAIGAVSVGRAEPGSFSERQIELLKTFADQAVIAIANVRLFTELQASNRELTTALDTQTATSDILRVISSSPTDVQPVFDAIAANAARLCDAVNGLVIRFDGELLHLAAQYNVDPERLAAVRQAYPRPPSRGALSGRAILMRDVVHVPDVSKDPEYTLPTATTIGYRSVLAVPMMHEGIPRGTILVARDVVAPFSDAHIALIQTFADQAVIAIENVRLFKELQEKNRALTEAHAQVSEALDQQTATAEILRVISQSPTDVQPVFDAIAESAARLCDGIFGIVYRLDGNMVQMVAHHNASPEGWAAYQALYPRALNRQTNSGRAMLDGRVAITEDIEADTERSAATRDAARLMGLRSAVTVPLLHKERTIGALTVGRDEPGTFSPKQVALLQTFADQAVIAIENARLFNETKAALERQTATSEILRVISRSPTDVQPVFDAIIQNALQLCEAGQGTVFRFDGSLIHVAAHHNVAPEAADVVRRVFPLPPGKGSVTGRAILTRAVVHVPDLSSDSEHMYPELRETLWRAVLSVPMLRDGVPIGAISVTRHEPGPFSDDKIELLKTFADQAVIAIENVRLFKELEARTGDLTRSVEQLTALGEVGRAVSSTLDLETVLSTIVLRAVHLSGLDGGVVFEYDETAEEFVQRAMTETGEALAEARRATRIRKGEGVLGRTAITLEPVQVADIAMPGAYEGRLRDILLASGIRAILAVPMVRESQLIGCLGVTRNRPGEFPPETIELLRTFATQSALAIQNARLFREIEQKSRELEAASRHKSEFLANMSHELRTPLNAVIGFSEVLSERMFGELNEKQDEYLKDIHASGQHLLSLINDILDLSKIEAGRMELELSDFDLPMTIDNALMLIRERAARRSIVLNTAVDERVGQVHADERKIRQVLLNLLSNAIKFTPEGGRIHVEARLVNESIEVSVTDTGVGIAPEDQEAVFEEFRQVGTAEKKVEGTGLGLALSRKFIELHGGKIWVESQVGEGSTFTFTVPVRRGE